MHGHTHRPTEMQGHTNRLSTHRDTQKHTDTRVHTWTYRVTHTDPIPSLRPHLPLRSPFTLSAAATLASPMLPRQGGCAPCSGNALQKTGHMANSLISFRSLPRSHLLREGSSGHLTKILKPTSPFPTLTLGITPPTPQWFKFFSPAYDIQYTKHFSFLILASSSRI